MKLSKKAIDARKKVLDIYPTARLFKYWTPRNEGRYVVYIPKNDETKLTLYLETDITSSPTHNKAWIDAYKYVLKSFLSMLEY